MGWDVYMAQPGLAYSLYPAHVVGHKSIIDMVCLWCELQRFSIHNVCFRMGMGTFSMFLCDRRPATCRRRELNREQIWDFSFYLPTHRVTLFAGIGVEDLSAAIEPKSQVKSADSQVRGISIDHRHGT